MQPTTEDIRAQINEGLQTLRTLRDEIRVRAHLLSMDMKQVWTELEPRVAKAEEAAKKATDASKVAISEALQALKEFRAKLPKA